MTSRLFKAVYQHAALADQLVYHSRVHVIKMILLHKLDARVRPWLGLVICPTSGFLLRTRDLCKERQVGTYNAIALVNIDVGEAHKAR
jgi:hypothetical protein